MKVSQLFKKPSNAKHTKKLRKTPNIFSKHQKVRKFCTSHPSASAHKMRAKYETFQNAPQRHARKMHKNIIEYAGFIFTPVANTQKMHNFCTNDTTFSSKS
jgi:hypothetical protein